MLQFFRKVFSSRIGAAFAIAILILIALAFASGDVASTGGFGGVAGGDRVATVGNERIDTASLSQAATTALERVKEEDPRMSMKGFLASGALEKVLGDMIDRTAIAVFGRQNGIVANDRLIDSEITQMGAFKGPDGTFSQQAFDQAMQQRGINEKMVRADIAQGLIAKQVLVPAAYGAMIPRGFAKRYAELLRDRRTGAMAVLPSALFAPKQDPDDKTLAAYYNAHQDDFIRPERRVIRYASFGPEIIKDVAAPTEAEIAALYKQNRAQYEPRETRTVTQLIVPTEAAAKAIVDEVVKGTSLEKAATEKGLETARLDKIAMDGLARQTSRAVADAVFAASKGAIVPPARSPLGWHLMRVDAIDVTPGRTLEQAHADIAAQLVAKQRREALAGALEHVEDQFDDGSTLADVARSLGVEVRQTPPITADGQVYQKPGEKIPEVLGKVVETAFTMEDGGDPQLAEVEPGKSFVIFDATDIQPSAPAPLKEIREDVTAAYMLDMGSQAAKDAAKKVQAAVKKGATLQQAVVSLKKQLPPVQQINMDREQLVRMQQQSNQPAPPPLALFFSMAEGTTKLLSAPLNRGWFVVSLGKIEPGTVKDDDPILDAAQKELGQAVGNEYAEAMRRAIRGEIGVKRNETAIKAVRDQLAGGS